MADMDQDFDDGTDGRSEAERARSRLELGLRVLKGDSLTRELVERLIGGSTELEVIVQWEQETAEPRTIEKGGRSRPDSARSTVATTERTARSDHRVEES